jgi:hypothetical protein
MGPSDEGLGADELALGMGDRQHRTRCLTYDMLGDAVHQEVLERGS